jgi:hypothetical protein
VEKEKEWSGESQNPATRVLEEVEEEEWEREGGLATPVQSHVAPLVM